jgi:hypothetical protein
MLATQVHPDVPTPIIFVAIATVLWAGNLQAYSQRPGYRTDKYPYFICYDPNEKSLAINI